MLLLQLPWGQKFSSMQEIKFKIKQAESANVEIIPCADGVEIVVRYGESQKNYGSSDNKPFKFHNGQKTPEEIIEGMKTVARKEYQKPGADKEELKKFVEFYERKINEDGWKGAFDFYKLYDRWLSNKR